MLHHDSSEMLSRPSAHAIPGKDMASKATVQRVIKQNSASRKPAADYTTIVICYFGQVFVIPTSIASIMNFVISKRCIL